MLQNCGDCPNWNSSRSQVQNRQMPETWNVRNGGYVRIFRNFQEKQKNIFFRVDVYSRIENRRDCTQFFDFNVLIDIPSEISNSRWTRVTWKSKTQQYSDIYTAGVCISALYKSISRYGAEQLGFYHIYLSRSPPTNIRWLAIIFYSTRWYGTKPNKRVQLRHWFLARIVLPTVDDYYCYLPRVSHDASIPCIRTLRHWDDTRLSRSSPF